MALAQPLAWSFPHLALWFETPAAGAMGLWWAVAAWYMLSRESFGDRF